MFALGWTGSARAWHRYERAYLLLAALATPLVLSVHSVVSFDFAVAQLPGWHTTIFPPYFVAGAIFSGFAMVVTLAVPARAYFGLKNLITPRHLENICKIILVTSLMVGYAYSVELFMAWYSQNPYESFVFLGNRPFGPYGVCLLDHGLLQRVHSAAVLVQEVPHHALDHGDHRGAGERGHVDGAIRDHDVAHAGFSAVELGHVHTVAD